MHVGSREQLAHTAPRAAPRSLSRDDTRVGDDAQGIERPPRDPALRAQTARDSSVSPGIRSPLRLRLFTESEIWSRAAAARASVAIAERE
jgi:hypothetical protein